ncbi:hypothetical protein N8477_06545 [Candidatus Thioglobus sp.]|nr:hypothetical protein [Candidatus Thioglobus sp.]
MKVIVFSKHTEAVALAMRKHQAFIDSNDSFWKTVFSEDIGVIEGMQRGRSGLMFDGA